MTRILTALMMSVFLLVLGMARLTTEIGQPKYDTDVFYMPAARVNEVVTTRKGGTNNNGNELIPRNTDLGIRASVGRKEMTPPVTSPEAHDDFGHIYQIAEGAGTLVLGGELVNATHKGTSWSGTAIKGGKEYKLSKGDMITVPVGIPHWWKEVPEGGVTYIAYHSFPEHHQPASAR